MALVRLAPAATALALAAVGISPAFAQQAAIVRGGAAEIRVLRPLRGEVIAPGTFSLETSFQARTAAKISAAELYVDGVRWARRDFDAPLAKYVLSFEVDGRTLAAGEHKVTVKLIAEDGTSAETDVPLLVDGPKPVAPVVAPTARSGYGPTLAFRPLPKKLTGTVEIDLSIKEENLNPYVSFFVDNQFKTLKNYPPYTFAWDTTTATNGYHVIKATGYLESTGVTSEQRIQVYVDNPGGFTNRVAAPDKTVKTSEPSPSLEIKSTVAAPEAVAARLSAGVRIGERAPIGLDTLKAPEAPSMAVSGIFAPVAPGSLRTIERSAPLSPSREVLPATMGLAAPAALRTVPVGRPVAVAPYSLTSAHTVAIRGGAQVRRPATITASRPSARVNTSHLAKMPDLSAPLQVAFDGTMIAFDVAPRIENGLPLAPFRQIFEHTGGLVTWAHNEKTVRAVNSEREVVFTVGAPQGKVNGEAVKMDRKAYIESGRAIVPLSFVGKALDVKVDFDPATGRLQITSQK